MNNAKLVAWGILISIIFSVVVAFFSLSEDLYTLAGVGYLVFGIWAAVLLLENKDSVKIRVRKIRRTK